MSISFLTCDVVDNQLEASALNLISYLLCDTANSPLYKALLESGLAPSYSPGNGFEAHYKEGLFNLGVQGRFFNLCFTTLEHFSNIYSFGNSIGIGAEDVEEIERVIMETLQQVKEEGFDKGKLMRGKFFL